MQYFDVALASTHNPWGIQPRLQPAAQVQAACKKISARWDPQQRNQRRVEAKRLQAQLFLLLIESKDQVDKRI